MSCSITDKANIEGYRGVVLENDYLSIAVLPDRGAEVRSLVNRRNGIDVLWKAPWGLPPQRGGDTEAHWMDGYGGGWQEIFPNGGDACVYNGAPLGFHGEASVSRWESRIDLASDRCVAADFTVALVRSPFRVRRRMIVEDSAPAVRIEEEIVNEGEEPLKYMWGHHPAYGAPFLSGDCVLEAPASTYLPHGSDAAEQWPGMIPISAESERFFAQGYLGALGGGSYELRNRRLGFGVRWSWPVEVFPYIWLWRELRGSFGYPWYGRCYVMGIEPFTSIPGSGLVEADRKGTAPTLAAGARASARLRVEFT